MGTPGKIHESLIYIHDVNYSILETCWELPATEINLLHVGNLLENFLAALLEETWTHIHDVSHSMKIPRGNTPPA